MLGHRGGITWLDNLRQGQLVERSLPSRLADQSGVEALASADLNNDGRPELIVAGQGLSLWRNLGASFEEIDSGIVLPE